LRGLVQDGEGIRRASHIATHHAKLVPLEAADWVLLSSG
jgi:hypothetical protein